MSRFKVGEIVRYGVGPTALMRVSHISLNHGGHADMYHGEQCYGGAVGSYDDGPMGKATEVDLEVWESERRKYHIDRPRDL